MSSHEQPAISSRAQTDVYRVVPGGVFCPTERCEQPRVARLAGVAPSDARSIGQLRVTVSSQERGTCPGVGLLVYC
jgi:hypothetical protein